MFSMGERCEELNHHRPIANEWTENDNTSVDRTAPLQQPELSSCYMQPTHVPNLISISCETSATPDPGKHASGCLTKPTVVTPRRDFVCLPSCSCLAATCRHSIPASPAALPAPAHPPPPPPVQAPLGDPQTPRLHSAPPPAARSTRGPVGTPADRRRPGQRASTGDTEAGQGPERASKRLIPTGRDRPYSTLPGCRSWGDGTVGGSSVSQTPPQTRCECPTLASRAAPRASPGAHSHHCGARALAAAGGVRAHRHT